MSAICGVLGGRPGANPNPDVGTMLDALADYGAGRMERRAGPPRASLPAGRGRRRFPAGAGLRAVRGRLRGPGHLCGGLDSSGVAVLARERRRQGRANWPEHRLTLDADEDGDRSAAPL